MRITVLTHRKVCLAIAAVAMAIGASAPVSAQQGATYEVVSTFGAADGKPNGVIQTFSGQFYGTAIDVHANPPRWSGWHRIRDGCRGRTHDTAHVLLLYRSIHSAAMAPRWAT